MSPGWTWKSRPGQSTTSGLPPSVSAGRTTAIGTRSPYNPRRLDEASTGSVATRKVSAPTGTSWMRRLRHASTIAGAARPGHVQHGARTVAVGHRAADRLIAQLRDDPHVGPHFPCHQGDLEIGQVVVDDAQHRPGLEDAGHRERLRRTSERGDRGDTPPDGDRQLGLVGVLLQHGDRLTGAVQLLDDPQTDPAQPADDHMPGRTGVGGHLVDGGFGGHRRTSVRVARLLLLTPVS